MARACARQPAIVARGRAVLTAWALCRRRLVWSKTEAFLLAVAALLSVTLWLVEQRFRCGCPAVYRP